MSENTQIQAWYAGAMDEYLDALALESALLGIVEQ